MQIKLLLDLRRRPYHVAQFRRHNLGEDGVIAGWCRCGDAEAHKEQQDRVNGHHQRVGSIHRQALHARIHLSLNFVFIIIMIIYYYYTLFLPEARCVCRQAAVEAATILPLDGLARSKQDQINGGHGAQYLYRPPPAGANVFVSELAFSTAKSFHVRWTGQGLRLARFWDPHPVHRHAWAPARIYLQGLKACQQTCEIHVQHAYSV